MRGPTIVVALLWGVAVPAACTQAQNDCNRNPELACFVEGGAGGTTTTISTGGTPACGEPGADKCNGDLCSSPGDCASGYCVDGLCCDKACDGTCQACSGIGKDGTCAPLPAGDLDVGSPTGETCMDKGGCGETLGYCSCEDGVLNGDEVGLDCGGSCPLCKLGVTCGGVDAACNSNHCVDGVCCDSLCDTPCYACGLPETLGACTLVPPETVDPGCSGANVCSGKGTCATAAGGACSAPGECVSGQCTGGLCVTCTQMADCPGGLACDSGVCVSPASEGMPCLSDLGCKSGDSCVDRVCCTEACSGLCMSCNVAYTGQPSGTCAPILAGYDPHDECVGAADARACSGAAPDLGGQSACGQP